MSFINLVLAGIAIAIGLTIAHFLIYGVIMVCAVVFATVSALFGGDR